jgi:hypothetical protein
MSRKALFLYPISIKKILGGVFMEFFNSAIDTFQTLVIAIGAGLGVWGIINLLEGYGNDNPGAKSQGIKQLMSGAGIAIVGMVLVPMLSSLFS